MNARRILLGLVILAAWACVLSFAGLGPWQAWLPDVDSAPWLTGARPSVDRSHFDVPSWLTPVASFATLLLAGCVCLYLTPARIGRMRAALGTSWRRWLQVLLTGLAFLLMGVALGFSASLSRLTFPITVLSGASLFVLCLWGYVTVAYSVGSAVMHRVHWRASPLGALFLGLLILQPLVHIPLLLPVTILSLAGLSLGVVITTRFGSNDPWSLNPLLEA
jgi:hypothetical protein